MSDLSQLSPAPWRVEEGWSDIVGKVWQVFGPSGVVGKFLSEEDANQFVLARNALEVMMWRGWYAYPSNLMDTVLWTVAGMPIAVEREFGKCQYRDPFTALVEAEKWYRNHIQAAQQ